MNTSYPESVTPQQSQPAQFFSEASLPWGWRERASTIVHDNRPQKLDLCTGVLRNPDGSLPTFQAVRMAREVLAHLPNLGYLPPTGLSDFKSAIRDLLLGERSAALADRTVAVQTIGGANALRLAGDCLARLKIADTVYISQESWGDHRRIFERAGMAVEGYKYLSTVHNGLDRDGLLQDVSLMRPGSVLLLQASCHNPTGYDLSKDMWLELFDRVKERNLLPLFDVAYPGLGEGLEADLWPIRTCLERGIDLLVAASCCKSFSLYDARVGALVAVVSDANIAQRLESQIKIDIQASYSSPPREGASVIARVLSSPELSTLWRAELDQQRKDLGERRAALVDELQRLDASPQLLRIGEQRGLFAWTGMDRNACKRLAEEFALYVPSNGRVCVGALPLNRVADVAAALVAVSERPETARADLRTVARAEKVEQIVADSAALLQPSPPRWLEASDLPSYAVRQATSCTYLEVLFPNIINASPATSVNRLQELFRELTVCHQRQYLDLSEKVAVPPIPDRRSYYFDSMYRLSAVPDFGAGCKLDEQGLLNLLAVHAVSYLRGHERYTLLKDFVSDTNQILQPVWKKFFVDAPRNARLTVDCMLDLFDPAHVESAMRDAALHEGKVMAAIWRHSGLVVG